MHIRSFPRGSGFTVAVGLLACTTAEQSPQPPPFLPPLPPGAETVSFRGDTLYPPAAAPEVRASQEADVRSAEAAWRAHPADVDSMIWYGRRLAYLGRYRDAVTVYTHGIALHPDEPRLYRHRGHRFITLRMLDRAIADLAKAAELVAGEPDEIEPDGQPNSLGISLSTLQFNIWYHLGLAHYLRGDFPRAASAYRLCLDVSRNPDLQVATRYWLYLTLRRMGADADAEAVLAPVTETMEIIENGAYFRLLLVYKRILAAESVLADMQGTDALQNATLGYGIARSFAHQGRESQARAMLERILAGPQWAAFGYIAAEADVAREN